MSLSICLLTRDAYPHIERALRSVAPLGAEVILGDTGSRDGTVEAAQALGATVVAVPWADDFGAAQNLVLDRARGDWVLWLNPDEEYVGAAREPLAALLARPDALAYLVRIEQVMQPDATGPTMETWWPRLFRRLPAVRFAGRLHPHFDPPLDELARGAGMQIFRSDLLLRHHGYVSTLTQGKLRWATRLLEMELRDRPGQLHYLIEYGRNLLLLNDSRGHDVLAEAAEQVAAAAASPTAPLSTVASLLEYLLTVAPEQSRSRIGRSEAAALARRWFADSPPLLWVLARQAFEAGAFGEAAGLLERLVHLGRTGTYDRSAAFDPSIMAGPALLNLGHCYLRLGEPDRAEACFQQALSEPAHAAAARQGLAMAQARKAARDVSP